MKIETIQNPPVSRRFNQEITASKFWQFTGTPREFIEWAETLPKFAHYVKYHEGSESWAGFHTETPRDAIKARFSRDAHAALQASKGTLQAPIKAPGKPTPSPVGASFNMGRILSGHPLSAYRRPRVSLPPKIINLALSASCTTNEKDIARSISKIAKAAWEYHLQGGIVKVNIHHILFFTSPDKEGRGGLISTFEIPLADLSAVATGVSVQAFRGFCIPAAQALSPVKGDGLPVGNSTIPGVFTLTGRPEDDDKALEALRID